MKNSQVEALSGNSSPVLSKPNAAEKLLPVHPLLLVSSAWQGSLWRSLAKTWIKGWEDTQSKKHSKFLEKCGIVRLFHGKRRSKRERAGADCWSSPKRPAPWCRLLSIETESPLHSCHSQRPWAKEASGSKDLTWESWGRKPALISKLLLLLLLQSLLLLLLPPLLLVLVLLLLLVLWLLLLLLVVLVLVLVRERMSHSAAIFQIPLWARLSMFKLLMHISRKFHPTATHTWPMPFFKKEEHSSAVSRKTPIPD